MTNFEDYTIQTWDDGKYYFVFGSYPDRNIGMSVFPMERNSKDAVLELLKYFQVYRSQSVFFCGSVFVLGDKDDVEFSWNINKEGGYFVSKGLNGIHTPVDVLNRFLIPLAKDQDRLNSFNARIKPNKKPVEDIYDDIPDCYRKKDLYDFLVDDLKGFFPSMPNGETERFIDLIPESKRAAWKARVKEFNEREDEI